jgi:uncharacterized protein (DUF488 family)
MGVEQLEELAKRAIPSVMCAEEDPRCCHRRVLITPALERRGVDVIHIRGDGRLQSEDELRAGLPQLSLFE